MSVLDITSVDLGDPASQPGSRLLLPLYECRVAAGFPSPANDFLEQSLDPTELLIKRPAATFFVRASGPSMQDAGIYDGSILVVDRAETVKPGRIVIAEIDGGLTVKRLVKGPKGRWVLAAANPAYPDISIPEDGLRIWGVVTWVLTELVPR